jgi:putative DNA primase/helicase
MTALFGEQPLIGKTVAIFSDVNWTVRENGVAIEKLKSISGEDARTVHRKNCEAWEGKLKTRFIMTSNDEPDVADPSGALAARFVTLRFHNRRAAADQDPKLDSKLRAELPGILNWALLGLAELRESGRLFEPAHVEAERDNMRAAANPVADFLDERATGTPAPDAVVPSSVLYQAYEAWCGRAGVRSPLSRRKFVLAVRAARPDVELRVVKVDGKTVRCVVGLAELFPGSLTTTNAE